MYTVVNVAFKIENKIWKFIYSFEAPFSSLMKIVTS
jgi:hypothetical protein